jgi:hypothetical protein
VAALEVEVGPDWRERAVDPTQLASASQAAELAAREDTLSWADLGRALQRRARALALDGQEEAALAALDEVAAIWARLERASAAFLVALRAAALRADIPALEALAARTADGALAPYHDTAHLMLGCAYAAAGERAAAVAALEVAREVRAGRGKAAPLAEVEALLARLS